MSNRILLEKTQKIAGENGGMGWFLAEMGKMGHVGGRVIWVLGKLKWLILDGVICFLVVFNSIQSLQQVFSSLNESFFALQENLCFF